MDLERWWPASNSDHVRLEIMSPDKSIAEGTQIDFEERIAGVKAVASGRIVSLHKDSEATWEGTAVYHYKGFKVPIHEGVKWRIAPMSDLAIVSASVWAAFPRSLTGRLLKWHAMKHMNIVELDREHTRLELNYLKDLIEKA